MHCAILFYCTFISTVFVIISAQNCVLPNVTGALAAATFSLPDFVQDVNDFQDNFDERFKELKKYVDENIDRANEIDVGYLLYTPKNPDKPYRLRPTLRSLLKSNFRSRFQTIFIIHGYLQKLRIPESMTSVIQDKLLDRGQYNVIVVNYTSQSQGLISETIRNSFLVSQNIANFINFLLDHTLLKPKQIHLMGPSLGAQISGNVGHIVPGIGRITGLDPAGPIFIKFPPSYRLSYHDADFVDIIHSSAIPFPRGLGYFEALGHQDFFPNGGAVQPGCPNNYTQPGSAVQDVLNAVCDHDLSISQYIASICSGCQFIGVMCDSYENFQKGLCTDKNSVTAVMGFEAKKNDNLPPKSKFYLNTADEFPFCLTSQ